jgi:hypothetical protein
MSRHTIPVMVVCMRKMGPYSLSLLRARNTFAFFAVTNMFQGDTWIFSAPDPAVDMKRLS